VRNWRVISTIAAIVLAAIAGVLVWKYVTSADKRAERDKGLVSALVAKSRIARGTVFDQILADNLLKTVKIPRDSLPPDRIIPGKDDALLELYRGKVASTDIFTGTPVVSTQFVAASQPVNTLAGGIPKGKQVITVSLDQSHAVGGFVTPGDKVNLLLSFNPALVIDARTGRPTKAAADRRTTAFLLPGIKVIAVGSTTVLPSSANAPAATGEDGGTTSTTTPQNQSTSLITFEVTPRQAEQIVQGTTIGTVYLSLNPPGFNAGQFKSPDEIVEAINLFDQPLTVVQATRAAIERP
jgi:Flp pilus assembly protein CpaB